MNQATHDDATTRAIHLPPPSLVDRVRSVGLWGAGVSWLVPMLTGMTAAHKLRPDDKLETLNRLYCWGQLKLLGIRWHAEVSPAVDPTTPYLFLQNHTNHFDHVVLYNATSHYKQGIELREHFKYPVYGWFMKARGTIAVDKGRGGQSAEVLANMRAEVARGHSILGFPEGTRTVTGRVGAFRRGLFYIARDLNIPIVPVAVTGMYEVMRKGSLMIRGGTDVTVHVGAPIAPATSDEAEGGIDRMMQQTRAFMTDRVDAHWAAGHGVGR